MSLLFRPCHFSFLFDNFMSFLVSAYAADAKYLVTGAQKEAAEFRFKLGYEIPVDYLAKRYDLSHFERRSLIISPSS